MLETKEQKQYFWTAAVLVLILVGVTALSKPQSSIDTSVVTGKKAKFDYKAYLASIKIDPVASQKLLKNIVSEEEVKADVEKALQVNQTVTPITINDSDIHIVNTSGKQAVEDYASKVGQIAAQYDNSVLNVSKQLFADGEDPGLIGGALDQTKQTLKLLYAADVPKEAVNAHKSLIATLEAYSQTISLAKAYNLNPDVDPWPDVYKNYSLINTHVKDFGDQWMKLADAYGMRNVALLKESPQPSLVIPQAKAFGPTVVTGDIPATIREAVQEGLSSAFANFATQFLNKLILSIEKNYKIANYLYYSDALVRGEYVNDYLKKYVADPVDRQVVTRFIPQFNCGQSQEDLKTLYKAKSDEYLGFDPESLDPNDPDFNTKLSKMGDFLASPSGWELYYEDIAAQAESEAQRAADNELKGSGLKSPRDSLGTEIAASLNAISNSETAAFNASLNLGVMNAENIAGKIASSVTYNLFNKFVFKGATVYQEQNVCLGVPQLNPIIPASDSLYQEPPAPPTQEELNRQYNVTNP